MKKILVLSLVLILLFVLTACTSSTETLPAYSQYKPLKSDQGILSAEAEAIFTYSPVSEEDYEGFVKYLGDLGWTVKSQALNNDYVELVFVKGDLSFSTTYSASDSKLLMSYPAGTNFVKSWE